MKIMRKMICISLIVVVILNFVPSHNVSANNLTRWFSFPSARVDIKLTGVRLTLANDQILIDERAKTIVETERFLKYLNLIIAIDTESAMLDSTKQEIKRLVNELHNIDVAGYHGYDNDLARIRIGIIGFDSNDSDIGNVFYGIDANSINSYIDNIDGNKTLEQALKKVDENFELPLTTVNSLQAQALIIITDNVANDRNMINRTNNILENLTRNKMVPILNLMVTPSTIGSTSQMAFSKEIPTTATIKEAVDNILDIITDDIITTVPGVLESIDFTGVPHTISLPDGGLYIEMEHELMHGAILEVEYTIRTTMDGIDLYKLTTEMIGDIVYTPGTKLLSEPHLTNADQGWIVQNGELYLPISEQDYQDSTNTVTKRIVFFTTLSPMGSSDHMYYNKSIATFSFIGVPLNAAVLTPKLAVIPPTGGRPIKHYIFMNKIGKIKGMISKAIHIKTKKLKK